MSVSASLFCLLCELSGDVPVPVSVSVSLSVSVTLSVPMSMSGDHTQPRLSREIAAGASCIRQQRLAAEVAVFSRQPPGTDPAGWRRHAPTAMSGPKTGATLSSKLGDGRTNIVFCNIVIGSSIPASHEAGLLRCCRSGLVPALMRVSRGEQWRHIDPLARWQSPLGSSWPVAAPSRPPFGMAPPPRVDRTEPETDTGTE